MSESWWNLVNWEYASEQYDAAVAVGTKAPRKESLGGNKMREDRHRGSHGGRHNKNNRV